MQTRLMTTAAVVLSPTPLAPPVVVVPHPQATTATVNPNTADLMTTGGPEGEGGPE